MTSVPYVCLVELGEENMLLAVSILRSVACNLVGINDVYLITTVYVYVDEVPFCAFVL